MSKRHKWVVDRDLTGTTQYLRPCDVSNDVIEVCEHCGLRRNGQTKQGPNGYFFRREYWDTEYFYEPSNEDADKNGYISVIVERGRRGEIGAGRRCK